MKCNFQQNTVSKSAFVQIRIVINSNYNHYFFSVRQIKKSFVHETYNLANQHNSLSFHKAFIRMTVLVPFRPRLAVFAHLSLSVFIALCKGTYFHILLNYMICFVARQGLNKVRVKMQFCSAQCENWRTSSFESDIKLT